MPPHGGGTPLAPAYPSTPAAGEPPSKKEADLAEAVVRAKRTNATVGLTDAEVAALTLEFGKNELPEKKKSKILQVREGESTLLTRACAHAQRQRAPPLTTSPAARSLARGSSSATCGARCRS